MSSSQGSRASSSQRSGDMRELRSNAPKCFHNEQASIETTWKRKNPGKRFYGCAFFPAQNCGFFEWIDTEQYGPRALEVINGLKDQNDILQTEILRVREAQEQSLSATNMSMEESLRKYELKITKLKEAKKKLEKEVLILKSENGILKAALVDKEKAIVRAVMVSWFIVVVV